MIKKGFTLAEVLIAIAVLGIIAAMTVPALMSNVDKSAWAQGMRTNMTVITNGFANMLADQEVDSVDDTELWTEAVNKDDFTESDIREHLGKYFKIDKIEKGVPSGIKIIDIEGNESALLDEAYRIYLDNSAALSINFQKSPETFKDCTDIEDKGGTLCEEFATIYIDSNGNKKPNMLGHDITAFKLSRTGTIYAYGSLDVNLLDSSIPEWNTTNGCQGKTPANSLACTQRIIDEGYKIDYK